MALSDSFTTNTLPDYGVNFSITLSWTATQSVQNNQSTISWSLRANTIGSGYVRGVYGIRLLIDNNYALNTTGKRGDYGDGAIIRSGSTVVNHNNDGSKTLSISLVAQVGQSSSWTNYIVSGSKSTVLNTIPRASQITIASTHSITSSTGNLEFTITPYASFYHRIIWTLNNNPTTVNYTTAISSATKKTDITNSLMLSKMGSTLGPLTLSVTLYTYSDSSLSTLVGTQTATCEVNIDSNNIKPTASITSVTKSSSPTSSYAIAGYSTLSVTWTAGASAGSSIKEVRIEIRRKMSGSSYSVIEFLKVTGTGATTTTSKLPANADNYTVVVAVTSIDNRNVASTTVVSSDILVYGYVPPIITLNGYRTATDASTDTDEDGAGAYAYVVYTRNVGSSINNWNKIKSTSCTYSGSKSGTISASGTHFALADDEFVTVTLTVTDNLSSISLKDYIAPALYPLDLYDTGSGTVGVAFGTTAESGMVKSALLLEVNNSIRSTNNMLVKAAGANARFRAQDTTHGGEIRMTWGGNHQHHGLLSTGYSTDGSTLTSSNMWLIYRTSDNKVRLSGGKATVDANGNIRAEGYGSFGGKLYVDGGQVISGTLTKEAKSYVEVRSIAGEMYLESGESATATKALRTMNHAGTYKTIIGVDQNNVATFYGHTTRSVGWFKHNRAASIAPNGTDMPPKVLIKQVGSDFSIVSGNIRCARAGTIRVTAKIFAWHNSTNGGAMTCWIRISGVNNEDTKTTLSWFTNGVLYIEGIFEIGANTDLSVQIKNVSASGNLSVQPTSTYIVEYLD